MSSRLFLNSYSNCCLSHALPLLECLQMHIVFALVHIGLVKFLCFYIFQQLVFYAVDGLVNLVIETLLINGERPFDPKTE